MQVSAWGKFAGVGINLFKRLPNGKLTAHYGPGGRDVQRYALAASTLQEIGPQDLGEARAVCLYTPSISRLFSRALLQSPALAMAFDRNGTHEQTFQTFTALAGCATQGLAYLRADSVETSHTANTPFGLSLVRLYASSIISNATV